MNIENIDEAVQLSTSDAKKIFDRWRVDIYPTLNTQDVSRLLEHFQLNFPQFYKLFPIIALYMAAELKFSRSAYKTFITEYTQYACSADYGGASKIDRDMKLIDFQSEYVAEIQIMQMVKKEKVDRSNIDREKLVNNIRAKLIEEYRKTQEDRETQKQQINKLNKKYREDNVKSLIIQLRDGPASGDISKKNSSNSTRLLMQSLVALVEHYWRDILSHKVFKELCEKVEPSPDELVFEGPGESESAQFEYEQDLRKKDLSGKY
jgi:hypothetical protein